jgi:hypothetical protein
MLVTQCSIELPNVHHSNAIGFIIAIFPNLSYQHLSNTMNTEIQAYNERQAKDDQAICELLATTIDSELPEAESKIWHAHPIWFLDGNPVVGYSKLKESVRLLFWSGQSFEEEGLQKEGTFKAAEFRYTSAGQVHLADLKRWLKKSREIQWDYKNLVKRKGQLERLK